MLVTAPGFAKSQDVEIFFETWGKPGSAPIPFPIDRRGELMTDTPFPAYRLQLPDFPLQEIQAGLEKVQSLCVEHRPGEGHQGWKGLTLHGLGSEMTMCPEDYGLKPDEATYSWTPAAEAFPGLKRFFQQTYPAARYGRIRLMLLEPGGFILPHRDREKSHLGPLSIPLSLPTNCHFMVEGFGSLHLKPGFGYLIDISRRHCLWNRSNQPRFQLIVEATYGNRRLDFLNLVAKSYPLNNWLSFLNRDYRRWRACHQIGNST